MLCATHPRVAVPLQGMCHPAAGSSWLILRHTHSCPFSCPCFLCPILTNMSKFMVLCSSFEDICP